MSDKAFPIVNDWARGCYLARVTGPHPKYRFDREFENGKPIKSRRTVEYLPGRDLAADNLPAWYVMRDRGGRDSLLAVTAVGWRVVASGLAASDVLDVFNMGAPGGPGAWSGDMCGRCDAPLIEPDGETGAICAECAGIESDRASAPDEVPF